MQIWVGCVPACVKASVTMTKAHAWSPFVNVQTHTYTRVRTQSHTTSCSVVLCVFHFLKRNMIGDAKNDCLFVYMYICVFLYLNMKCVCVCVFRNIIITDH
jgi:hypothetical protein